MASSIYTTVQPSGKILRHWHVTSLKTIQDAKQVLTGDTLFFRELTFTVTDIHTPYSNEYIFTGILQGKNPWNITPGKSITWGPLGIAASYEDYTRRSFIASKKPVYYYDC